MSSAPTVTKVLDGFLAARAATSSEAALGRCQAVIGAFRTYLDARDAPPVDDLTAYRLTHPGRRVPTEHDLAAVLAVIEHVTGFFESLAPDGLDAPVTGCADAADVIRELAHWLAERGLVDDDVAEHLDRYTHLYDRDTERTGS